MADNYNSNFTGVQVDDAVQQARERGVTTIDNLTTLDENRIIAGDAGGRNVKSTNISISDLESAITRSSDYDASGVKTDNTLASGSIIAGAGNHNITATAITTTQLQNSVNYSADYHDNGLINGPKADESSDLTEGNLVAYGSNNKIIDTSISASSLETMNIGVPQVNNSGTGYLLLNEIPGIKPNSEITIKGALVNAGDNVNFGAAVLYYGRNFYDVSHIKKNGTVSNELGSRNVNYTVLSSANRLFVPASNSVQSSGFTILSAASQYSGNVYTFDVKENHQYLVISKWTVSDRRLSAISTATAFNPHSIGFYNETNLIGSSPVVLRDTSGNIVLPVENSIAYTGGTLYAYSFVKPHFSYVGDSDVKTSWAFIQDATAIPGDVLQSMIVIDISEAGDDAYDVVDGVTGDLVFSLEQVYSKYISSYNSLIANISINRTKYCGPYYNAMDYFRPYYRNWFIKVPSGYRIFIKQYKTFNGSTPSGYLKTISVGSATSTTLVLDQRVELGLPCIEFMIGKSDDSAYPTGLATSDDTATASNAPLMQYVPAEYINKEIDNDDPLFQWVRHYNPINMGNGDELIENSLVASDYDPDAMWTSTTDSSKTYDLADVSGSDTVAIGVISFQVIGTAKFNMGVSMTDITKTYISYPLKSVNETTVQLNQKIDDLSHNSIISTAPTAKGSYKFTVENEGVVGHWEQEQPIDSELDLLSTNSVENRAIAEEFSGIKDGSIEVKKAFETSNISTNRHITDIDLSCPPITYGIAGGEAEIQTGISKFKWLEGKSKVWNQLGRNGNFASTSYWTSNKSTISANNNILTFTVNDTLEHAWDASVYPSYYGQLQATYGHVYLMMFEAKLVTGGSTLSFGFNAFTSSGTNVRETKLINTDNFVQCSIIRKFEYANHDGGKQTPINFSNIASIGDSFQIKNYMMFDLTMIYGSGKEPESIEEFRKDYPSEYYDYNTGSILSSKSYQLKSVGKNQFNGSIVGGGIDSTTGADKSAIDNFRCSGFIKVVPGQSYTLRYNRTVLGGYQYLFEYDIDQNYIGWDGSGHSQEKYNYNLSEKTAYVKFQIYKAGSGWQSNPPSQDIAQIMLYNNFGASFEEPYEAQQIQIVELPNIELCSVPDYTNGGEIRDIAYVSGGGKRRIGSYTFTGEETWTETAQGRAYCTVIQHSAKYSSSASVPSNLITNKYLTVSQNDAAGDSTKDKVCALNVSGAFIVKDSSVSSGGFAAAMAGLTVYFELETETDIDETENPGWTENVYVDNYGTLEFITSPTQIPQVEQPYFIEYLASLVEFLDSTYARFDGIADEIAKQEDIEKILDGREQVGRAATTESIESNRELSLDYNTCPPITFGAIAAGRCEVQNGNMPFVELHGNTVVWNQLFRTQNMEEPITTSYGITYQRNSITGICTFSGTSTSSNNEAIALIASVVQTSIDKTHKFLLKWNLEGTKPSVTECSTNLLYQNDNGDVGEDVIFDSTIRTSTYGQIVIKAGATVNFSIQPMIVDLTKMFGAGNEPTSVVEFNRLFPLLYSGYNTGELLSSQSDGLINRGINQFKGPLVGGNISTSTGANGSNSNNFRIDNYLRVIPGETYLFSYNYAILGGAMYIFEYDINNNYLGLYSHTQSSSYQTIQLSLNTQYVRFQWYKESSGWRDNVPNMDIVNPLFRLYYNTLDVPYEEYEEQVVSLPNIELRSAGEIYDIAYSTGGGKRRVGLYTFTGEETGTVRNTDSGTGYVTVRFPVLNGRSKSDAKILCPIAIAGPYNSYLYTHPGTCHMAGTTSIDFNLGQTSAEATAAALADITIYFELNELSEEDISLEENPGWRQYLKVNNYGTLEFTSEQAIQVPQAYYVKYTANLTDFLDSVYERSSGDAAKLALIEDVASSKSEITEELVAGQIEVAKAQTAEQLENVSEDSGSTQTVPFTFQATGTDNNTTSTPTAPIAKQLELRGNSVVWNQLVQNGNFSSTSGWLTNTTYGTLSVNNNELTYTVVSPTSTPSNAQIYRDLVASRISGHKYLMLVEITSQFNVDVRPSFTSQSSTAILANTPTLYGIITESIDTGHYLYFVQNTSNATAGQTIKYRNCQIFDLTKIYGAGKEPISVSIFNNDYPLPYYAYDSGSLKSCKSSKLVTIGCNALSGLEQGFLNNNTGLPASSSTAIRTKDFIKVVAGKDYKIDGYDTVPTWTNGLYLYKYDENKNYLGRTWLCNSTQSSDYKKLKTVIPIDNQTRFIKLIFADNTSLTYTGNEKVMIRLYWNEAHDYVDYDKHEYDLPDVELRSAGSAYDVIYSSGNGKRRIEYVNIIDMINAEYRLIDAANGSGKLIIFDAGYGYLLTHPVKAVSAMTKGNILTTLYETVLNNTSYEQTASGFTRTMDNFVSIGSTGFINIVSHDFDNLSTKQDLIDYFTSHPCYIQYELETEQDITSDSFIENIVVDDFGTMEFVSSSDNLAPMVPQGNKFFYPADYVLFIDDLYNRSKDGGEDADVDNFVVRSEYAIIQENIGGLLKHQLADRVNIEFTNIEWIDLGTLTWVYNNASTHERMRASLPMKRPADANTKPNLICSKFATITANEAYSHTKEGITHDADADLLQVYISTMGTDAEAFKASLKGILLAYEKASS